MQIGNQVGLVIDEHRSTKFKNSIKELIMRNIRSFLGLMTLALTFALPSHKAAAQPMMGGMGQGGMGQGGMGNMRGMGAMMGNPAQRAQMQVDSLRDSLAVTNDAEWDVISPRLLKVVQLKSDNSIAEIGRMMTPMMAMMGGMGGAANFLGVQPDPAADALHAALDNNGTAAQVKAALAKFREAKKQKQAELTKAQDALKEVLSIRQEATLAVSGYLE